MAFVHHSATGNNYTCAQAPSVLRGVYRYHTQSLGWRDLGYNFAVDKCGTVYEGRAGGVTRSVQGAHTMGFNTATTGIVVLGSFSSTAPPAQAVTGVARLTAWKLGIHAKGPARQEPPGLGRREPVQEGHEGPVQQRLRAPRRLLHRLPRRQAVRQARGDPLHRGQVPGQALIRPPCRAVRPGLPRICLHCLVVPII
ncbi:N-acetylmuramoyl-L-alanine amidase [Streptomyces sudanensis]|uniref:N-acetylmuramoyl-L-alanine amidase n=1 Tax=Streptomyces sudanensis TaxID=436397 RepID=UPI0020CE6CD9|nr:N-acetylmuramoyl-L-alanine amidase [Streptomyces sudanensis]MCP9958757.1 N-acetylmuramoyl-L-alanine amidase [Streptomyces sudanensis]